MEFPHGTISIDTQPDKFTIEFLWWNWCSWILISLLLQLNCHFIPLLLMMIKQRKWCTFSYFLDMVQKEFLNLKGISQQKLSPWKSFSSFLCEVSPIFYELYVFFLPWPKCNEIFWYSSSCWSCKVCKKVFCGFEKCLVSKVVFYIMLDVAWNSVVVVLLLGFCGLKKLENSLSFLEWRMCFRNPNLDQQHPLQAASQLSTGKKS